MLLISTRRAPRTVPPAVVVRMGLVRVVGRFIGVVVRDDNQTG
jgi:hypothetical protein